MCRWASWRSVPICRQGRAQGVLVQVPHASRQPTEQQPRPPATVRVTFPVNEAAAMFHSLQRGAIATTTPWHLPTHPLAPTHLWRQGVAIICDAQRQAGEGGGQAGSLSQHSILAEAAQAQLQVLQRCEELK